MARNSSPAPERSPLLRLHAAHGSTRSHEAEHEDARTPTTSTSPRLHTELVVRLLALQFLTMFAYYHLLAPRLRLLELMICRAHYEETDPSVVQLQPYWPGYNIDEHQCKIKDVQSRLSNIRSIAVFLEGLLTVGLSIPYGYAADRYGRRQIIILSILGLVLSNTCFIVVCSAYHTFAAEALIGSSAFLAIGGGTALFLAMTITMASEISSPEQRSSVLFWLLAAYYLATMSATALVLVTMTGLLLPFILAFIALTLSLPLALGLPDTRLKFDGPSPTRSTTLSTSKWAPADVRQRFSHHLKAARQHWRLVLAVGLFPLMASRGPMIELALPYVSNRYEWTLRQASALDTINAGISLGFAAVILPAVLKFIRASTDSVLRADGIVALYSSCAILLGSVMAGFANTIAAMVAGWVIYSTGCGIRIAVLAIATSLLPTSDFARLNTVIITVETMADLTLSPLIWQAWRAGLNHGGWALGLPWFIVAATMVLVLIALAAMLWPKTSNNSTDVDEE